MNKLDDGSEYLDCERIFTYNKNTFDVYRKFLVFAKEISNEQVTALTELINLLYSKEPIDFDIDLPVESIQRIIFPKKLFFTKKWFSSFRENRKDKPFKFKSYKTKNGFVYEIITPIDEQLRQRIKKRINLHKNEK